MSNAGVIFVIVLALAVRPTAAVQAPPLAAGGASPVPAIQEPVAPLAAQTGASPTPAHPAAPDPLIRAMLDEVSLDTVWRSSAQLSGAQPIIVDGLAYTITTRHTASGAPLQGVTQFVGD